MPPAWGISECNKCCKHFLHNLDKATASDCYHQCDSVCVCGMIICTHQSLSPYFCWTRDTGRKWVHVLISLLQKQCVSEHNVWATLLYLMNNSVRDSKTCCVCPGKSVLTSVVSYSRLNQIVLAPFASQIVEEGWKVKDCPQLIWTAAVNVYVRRGSKCSALPNMTKRDTTNHHIGEGGALRVVRKMTKWINLEWQ